MRAILELEHTGRIMCKKVAAGQNISTLKRYRREMAQQVGLKTDECKMFLRLTSKTDSVAPGSITPEEGSPRYYSQTINTPAAGDAA